MALITRNRLFVDVDQNRAYTQFGSFNISPEPFFIQGDQCPVELSLVRQTGQPANPFEQVEFDASATYALKIGTTTAVATSTTTATTPSAPSVTATQITTYYTNSWQVYEVEIAPEPLSGFFTLSDGTATTSPLSIEATSLEVQTAIVAFGAPYATSAVSVSKTGRYKWQVSFLCNTIGASVALTASGTGLVAFDSRVLTLDMTAAGVATLLNGAASAEATLEFSVDVSGDVQTFLYTPCTVINDL